MSASSYYFREMFKFRCEWCKNTKYGEKAAISDKKRKIRKKDAIVKMRVVQQIANLQATNNMILSEKSTARAEEDEKKARVI